MLASECISATCDGLKYFFCVNVKGECCVDDVVKTFQQSHIRSLSFNKEKKMPWAMNYVVHEEEVSEPQEIPVLY